MLLFASLVLVVLLGLVFGSFVTCISHRLPIGKSFLHGRSCCPKCSRPIAWYDNIPLLSFLLLRGRCRWCNRKISLRYPLIEVFTAFIFAAGFVLYSNCGVGNYYFCSWQAYLGPFTLPFLFFNLVIIALIFVIDLEHQIIPDEIVFIGWSAAVLVFFIFDQDFFPRLLSSFLAALFLLLLHLGTRGRGMGLGDVKFALYGGMLFTPILALIWVFLAFVLGATIGVVLIVFGKASFGKKIAFGPYLAVSLLICLVWAGKINLF